MTDESDPEATYRAGENLPIGGTKSRDISLAADQQILDSVK